jgi:hypothetical protein
MMINWEMKSKVQLLWEKKKDQKNDNQLRSEKRNGIDMREEEGLEERWRIEKRKKKWDCYKNRRRRIRRTMMNWEKKNKMRFLWEKKRLEERLWIEKKMKLDHYEKRGRRKIRRTMMNWEKKKEMRLQWEQKKKD